MGTNAASEPLYFIIIVIYDLWPTFSFLLPFPDCVIGNGRIDHLKNLLNNLFNIYYKY